jgi:hypothetical protein
MTSTYGTDTSTKQAWARGGMIFGATMMLVIGVFQIFLGIAAIVEDQFFVVGQNYAYDVDTTAWGWIHLGIGALAVLAGLFLFTGRMWARVIAIGLAALSAIANFFFLPYYPLWSLLIIALDVFVIWAVATARVDTGMGMAAGAGFAGEAGQSRERWPAENVSAGRHWAPEPAKEGVGTGQPAGTQAQEHVRAGGGYATPPTNPPQTPQTPPETPRTSQP